MPSRSIVHFFFFSLPKMHSLSTLYYNPLIVSLESDTCRGCTVHKGVESNRHVSMVLWPSQIGNNNIETWSLKSNLELKRLGSQHRAFNKKATFGQMWLGVTLLTELFTAADFIKVILIALEKTVQDKKGKKMFSKVLLT